MTQAAKTLSAMYDALADNTTGNITPRDIRDLIESVRARRGQIHVPANGTAIVTITNGDDYFEVTDPTWTLATTDGFDESAGNGRLTYTGAVPVAVVVGATCSLQIAGAASTLHLRIGVSGVTDEASDLKFVKSGGGEVQAFALSLVTTLAPDDYLSLWIRNESAANVEVISAELQAFTVPI